MNTFDALLEARRSIRDYEDRSVPLDLIRTLIVESTYAPSAGNRQPWKFVIVRDKSVMKRISDESKKNILARIEANPGDPSAKYEELLRNAAFNVFYNAPALVIIAGDQAMKSLHVDCALAAGYLMMAAASRGLGTCWVNMGAVIRDGGLRAELGLGADDAVVAPIIVGYPKQVPAPPERKPPEILAEIGD
jgi:nitroreductase